jgi:uncharacterized protein (TIGR00375 family)
MKFVADLHIHSKFSRATSRDMTFDSLACWGKVKGLQVVATGDFTHPEWFFLTKEKLEPAGNGFLRLKSKPQPPEGPLRGFAFGRDDVHFILSTEVSLIYSKKGKVRKVHVLILLPDLAAAEKLNAKLSGLGNLRSDGRPILGLDAKLLARIVLDLCPGSVVIPAHIWTPWFSLFGANSGFDAIEECFEELTPRIFALETGLSSDPAMNWRLSALDRFTLVSNSDAHSPSRLGREANAFDTDFSYKGLVSALRRKDPAEFLYTVEFFPEEGKYHYDGHRKCGVVLSPQESKRHNDLCPVCGKKLTIGVLHRVDDLADRPAAVREPFRVPFKSLIPLNEIAGEALGKSAESQAAWDVYFRLVQEFGNEHRILTEVPIAEIGRVASEEVGRALDLMRKGRVRIEPGHDGFYGKVSLLATEPEAGPEHGQLTLF